MKRVVVTGIGIVSSLGNNCREVLESLKNLKSGISFDESYREMGLRSNVAGNIKIDTKEHIDRKILRFMGDAAAYAYIAMKEAIAHAGLTGRRAGFQHPHRHRNRQRRRVFRLASGSRRHPACQRREAYRPLRRNQNHGLHRSRLLSHPV